VDCTHTEPQDTCVAGAPQYYTELHRTYIHLARSRSHDRQPPFCIAPSSLQLGPSLTAALSGPLTPRGAQCLTSTCRHRHRRRAERSSRDPRACTRERASERESERRAPVAALPQKEEARARRSKCGLIAPRGGNSRLRFACSSSAPGAAAPLRDARLLFTLLPAPAAAMAGRAGSPTMANPQAPVPVFSQVCAPSHQPTRTL
jgi:hypothetical protein